MSMTDQEYEIARQHLIDLNKRAAEHAKGRYQVHPRIKEANLK